MIERGNLFYPMLVYEMMFHWTLCWNCSSNHDNYHNESHLSFFRTNKISKDFVIYSLSHLIIWNIIFSRSIDDLNTKKKMIYIMILIILQCWQYFELWSNDNSIPMSLHLRKYFILFYKNELKRWKFWRCSSIVEGNRCHYKMYSVDRFYSLVYWKIFSFLFFLSFSKK